MKRALYLDEKSPVSDSFPSIAPHPTVNEKSPISRWKEPYISMKRALYLTYSHLPRHTPQSTCQCDYISAILYFHKRALHFQKIALCYNDKSPISRFKEPCLLPIPIRRATPRTERALNLSATSYFHRRALYFHKRALHLKLQSTVSRFKTPWIYWSKQ